MNRFLKVTTAILGFAVGIAGAETLESSGGPIDIHPVQHASFVLNWKDTTVFVDPVGGAEGYSEFKSPDLVLITHRHGDHFDLETLKGVVTEATSVVAPADVADLLESLKAKEITALGNGDSLTRAGIQITAIPAYNLHPDRLKFHPKGRDNGYVLTLGDTRLYISGDTEDIPEMRALKDIDAAFLCMNLPYTMDVEHAAGAVLDFAPTIVFPYHFRGKNGMSDLKRFTQLVSKNPKIQVRVLDWYPK